MRWAMGDVCMYKQQFIHLAESWLHTCTHTARYVDGGLSSEAERWE